MYYYCVCVAAISAAGQQMLHATVTRGCRNWWGDGGEMPAADVAALTSPWCHNGGADCRCCCFHTTYLSICRCVAALCISWCISPEFHFQSLPGSLDAFGPWFLAVCPFFSRLNARSVLQERCELSCNTLFAFLTLSGFSCSSQTSILGTFSH